MNIEETLKERGARYGVFAKHAEIAMALKRVMRREGRWEALVADQQQALDTIADKIARILNGDPNYHDNWHDICGYSKLVADRLLTQSGGGESSSPHPQPSYAGSRAGSYPSPKSAERSIQS